MKDFFKSFGFKVLAAIALVLVGVMIYAASTGGMATIPSMISGAILTPLQSAASAVSDGLNSFAGMFGSSTELQKQIDELQAELNDYRNKQVELDALREQNEWLKEYLNIIEQDNDYQFADARVIAIDRRTNTTTSPSVLEPSAASASTIRSSRRKDWWAWCMRLASTIPRCVPSWILRPRLAPPSAAPATTASPAVPCPWPRRVS